MTDEKAPNPTELNLKLFPDTVCAYKRVDCVRYEDCLDKASELNWKQFTCNSCTEYEPEEEIPIDLSSIAALLVELDRGRDD